MKFDILKTTENVKSVMKKDSPEIMIVIGVVGFFAAGVMACKATIKTEKTLNEHNDILEEVKNDTEIDEDEKKKIVATQYVMTTKEVIKNYAGPVLVATASAALIFAADREQNRRQAYLVSAYTAVDTAFKKYREAVINDQGEDKDILYKHGFEKKKISVIETDEEGNEKKVKKDALVVGDGYNCSQYAKFFDESCPDWRKDPESNLTWLRLQQNYANDKLKAKGHLFLNEVYDILGMPRTQAGAVVGWIYDKDNPVGDNFVDFGIYDIYNERKRDFVNGYEPTILLDFNVDGVIYDKI